MNLGLGLQLGNRGSGGGSGFTLAPGAAPSGSTFTRASTGYAYNSSGTLASNAIDVLRDDYSASPVVWLGKLIEPARTNGSRDSQAFTTARWTRRNAISVTDNSIVAPDGTTTGALLANVTGSGSNDMFEAGFSLSSRFPSSTALAWSLWVRPVSTSGTLVVSSPHGTSFGNASVNLALLTAGVWTRVYPGHPAVTTTTAFTSTAGGANGLLFACSAGAPISFYLWGPQLEAGAAYSSYIPTTTVSVTRAADALVLNWASRGVADGSYTMRYTFDDNTTQDVATTVASGTATVPTNLNRAWIKRVAKL